MKLKNAFSPNRQIKTTKQGQAGYDNCRENIDPHIRTKVITTSQGTIQATPTNNKDIVNKEYVTNNILWEESDNIITPKEDAQKLLIEENIEVDSIIINSGENFQWNTTENSGQFNGIRYNELTAGPNIIQYHARGTPESPNTLVSGDFLGNFNFRGHNGTAFTGNIAQIIAKTEETFTTSKNGTGFSFRCVENGTTTNREVIRIRNTGDLELIEGNLVAKNYIKLSKLYHIYGGFQDKSETISINAATWTHITDSLNELWETKESDGLSFFEDALIISNIGDYRGNLSITFEGGISKDYLFRIYNNSESRVEGYHIGATGQGNGNYTNVNIPIYIEAYSGDDFEIQVYCADGTDATFINAIFEITYLHE